MNKKNKRERYEEELEERLISLIGSLFGKKASELFDCIFVLYILICKSWNIDSSGGDAFVFDVA